MPNQTASAKKKAVLERIESLEQAIGRAREYLESGKYAQWSGFRPLFVHKVKDGNELSPHKDWIENVFLPSKEKALRRAEVILERMETHKLKKSFPGSSSSARVRRGSLNQAIYGLDFIDHAN